MNGNDGGLEAALFLESEGTASIVEWRLWLVPALLLLSLIAPLARDGIPATRAGLLPLHPELARELVSPAWVIEGVGSGRGYKALLAAGTVLGAGAVAWLASVVWGRRNGWWPVSLWLMLPLTIGLTYHHGWPYLLQGTALLGLGAAMVSGLKRPLRWLGFLPLIFGATALWEWQPGLEPFQLFAAAWPDPDNSREWVGGTSFQLGLAPLVLAALAAMSAWPQRHELAGRKVLGLSLSAAGAALLTLLGGPIPLILAVATLCLTLAAGGLPALDRRYDSPQVLLALLAVAALSVYPYLRPAWLSETPDQLSTSAIFGRNQFALLDVQSRQEGDTTIVEALWQATAPPQKDYSTFVHLLDGNGEMVGQADSLLLDGENISSARWPEGYLVRQEYRSSSAIPPSAIRLGLYDPESLQRLRVSTGSDNVTVPVP